MEGFTPVAGGPFILSFLSKASQVLCDSSCLPFEGTNPSSSKVLSRIGTPANGAVDSPGPPGDGGASGRLDLLVCYCLTVQGCSKLTKYSIWVFPKPADVGAVVWPPQGPRPGEPTLPQDPFDHDRDESDFDHN